MKKFNIISYNFRLGEIESAIGIEQLKKLPKLALEKQKLQNNLVEDLMVLKD